MRNKFSFPSLIRTQRGSTLIVGLILLAVMSIMVAATVAVTILQERMAGNMRDQALAFQRGEEALVAAEDIMNAAPFDPFTKVYFEQDCSAPVNGLCSGSSSDSSIWVGYSESDWNTKGLDGGNDARYIVKFLDYAGGAAPSSPNEICDVMFQVIARAPGEGSNTYVLLESTLRQRTTCN